MFASLLWTRYKEVFNFICAISFRHVLCVAKLVFYEKRNINDEVVQEKKRRTIGFVLEKEKNYGQNECRVDCFRVVCKCVRYDLCCCCCRHQHHHRRHLATVPVQIVQFENECVRVSVFVCLLSWRGCVRITCYNYVSTCLFRVCVGIVVNWRKLVVNCVLFLLCACVSIKCFHSFFCKCRSEKKRTAYLIYLGVLRVRD